MWADNETPIDLLGFEYLVDSLEILLTEPRLLPVTIGVDRGLGLRQEQPHADGVQAV